MEKKFAAQVAGLLILIFLGAFLTKGSLLSGKSEDILNFFSSTPKSTFQKIEVGDATISAELADTSDKKSKGLSGRDHLASDSGMLFTFDNSDIYRFWMKGMKIPLDFIWIKDRKIVDLLINALPPPSNTRDQDLTIYQPNTSINKVLEVNSGFINQHKVHIGDTINILR